MKKTLYPRQNDAVKALYAALRKNPDAKPYADLFTSFGKALVAAKICNDGILAGKRVLQLVPTEELVKQNFAELMAYADDPGGLGRCVGGNTKVYQINRQCVVAMAKSFVNRAHASGKWDLVVIDECDLFSPKPGTIYQKIAAAILKNNPNCRFIGFTGSPYRQDLGLLHETGGRYAPFFTECCFEGNIKEAIAAGDLSPPKNISGHLHVDMDGLPVAGKDYDIDIMGARFEKILPHAVADMKAKYAAYGIKTSLIFASTVENARHIMTEWGDPSTIRLVVSDKKVMPSDERAQNLHWLENGEGERHIVNVGILTTGYNFPALQCVTYFRAILFPRLYVQIAGRVIRKHESKEWGYMLDYGTNIDRHGPIDDINIKAPKGTGDGEAPYRLCEDCGTKNAAQAKSCRVCGYVFPPPETGNYGMRSNATALNGVLVHDISKISWSVGETVYGSSKKPAISLHYHDHDNEIVFNEALRFDDTDKGQHLHAQARLLQLLKDKGTYFNTLMDMPGGVSVRNVSLLMEEWEDYLHEVRQITVSRQGKYYQITGMGYE